jgi:hypothetical protein
MRSFSIDCLHYLVKEATILRKSKKALVPALSRSLIQLINEDKAVFEKLSGKYQRAVHAIIEEGFQNDKTRVPRPARRISRVAKSSNRRAGKSSRKH